MKKFLRLTLTTMAVLLLGGIFASPARGQFIGYTSPQTVQKTLATAQACTGSTQVFAVPNLGQTQHWATATVSAANTIFTMQFFGQDNAGNVTAISDVMTVTTAPVNSNGLLTATGYFPIVQVNVNCTGGTFTLNYSGSSSSPVLNTGGYSIAAYDKVLATAADGTTGHNYSLNVSPNTNAGGVLIFQYTANGETGSQLNLSCASTESNTFFQTQTITPANQLGPQVFPISAFNCPFPQILYTSGTIVAGTKYNLEYLLTPPGIAPPADPCQGGGFTKQSAVINITSATTTQLVPVSGISAIFVCGVSMTIAPSATSADTAAFEYGTGGTCGTGTTVLTGAFGAGDLTTTAPPLFVTFADPGTTIAAPAGNAICLVSAGTTVNIQGVLTYVRQ